jgi:hypothetical protein
MNSFARLNRIGMESNATKDKVRYLREKYNLGYDMQPKEQKMSVSEMICKLESHGLIVQRLEHDNGTLHVDGYHPPHCKGLPDWLYDCPGWGVSSCGASRVFMFKVG